MLPLAKMMSVQHRAYAFQESVLRLIGLALWNHQAQWKRGQHRKAQCVFLVGDLCPFEGASDFQLCLWKSTKEPRAEVGRVPKNCTQVKVKVIVWIVTWVRVTNELKYLVTLDHIGYYIYIFSLFLFRYIDNLCNVCVTHTHTHTLPFKIFLCFILMSFISVM